MKKRRILSWLLVFTMVMTFVPVFEFSVAADPAPTVIQSDTKENTNQAGGIIYTKTSTAKSDGTIDITLTAHTTGEVKQTNIVSPTDIVLVLDVSGSMNDNYTATTITGYNEETGSEYTYTTGWWIFEEEHTAYGLEDTSGYYINTGTEQEPVYTAVTYTGRDANGFEMYEYSQGETEVLIYPVLSGSISATRENAYPVIQFYSAVINTQTVNKMTSLKNAVNSFIDTTAQMNKGLSKDQMHTISIVKFADDSYYNSTFPIITEGNHKGAGGSSSYNYSEVVKNLTPVDDAGATELKNAVGELDAGGATAVDYGLNLAEAVLENRSQVVTEGAVDRNEVVIVFTDGEPNHGSGFSSSVANDAIATASRMESVADVTVYGVCIDTNANATDLTANINKFMHYMSSNYPNAESMTSPGTGDINNGYYMTPDGTHSLSMLFESIIQEIDHPTVTMGEEATMVDTISPYFDFENGNATEVKLQTSAKKADGTWADPVDDASLSYTIVEDRLTVDGFDFDANYVSEKGRGNNNDFYGKRLVVTFTVIPDYDVIDAASVTLMDGILPTNSGFATLDDSNSNSQAEVETPELVAHQVTYKVDGVEYTSYNRFTGSDIAVDEVPVKEGYTFSGWQYPSNITVSGNEFVMPNEDVEITGIFTPNTYNVTYKYSTETTGAPALPASHPAQYGSEVTVAAPATLEGYVFVGWYPLQTDVAINEGKFIMPAKDVTLVGYFEPSTATPYKVEHYLETLEDGVYEATPELEESFYGTTGNTVTATPLNRFTGFEYNATQSASTISGEITADGKLVLKVYYDRKEYKVTYGYDGDTQITGLPALPTGGTYKYGQTVTVADKAVPPAGYEFTGWYRGTTDNAVDGTFTMPDYDVHLLGYFTANTGTEYMVEHYLMGTDGAYSSTPEVTNKFTGTTGNNVEANPLPTFEGFTYNAGVSTATGVIAGDGSLVLKLYYDRNKYTVTYEYERTVPTDATPLPVTASYYHGETVNIEADATATGYTFSGWHVHGEDVTVNNGSFEMPKRNVNVYGYFTANTDTAYKVEHYVEKLDGTGYEADPYTTQNLTGTTGAEVTATSIAIPGFTYNEAESVGTRTGTIAADGSLVLKLYYDRNEYTVTYEYEGDIPSGVPSLPADATYAYGANVTVADKADAPAGYTFVGWYRGEVTNTLTSFTMPDTDVILKGYFKPDSGTEYNVEHYLMGTDGNYATTPEVTENFTGTTGHDVEAKPLATFAGFTYNAGESTASGTILGDGSLVLKLYYDRNKYTVTYEYERTVPTDATPLPVTASYYHGETVNIEADATATGYTFNGWHVHVDDVNVSGGSFEMPKRNVNVYGYFTANTDTAYKVEHYVKKLDGTGYEDEPYTTQNLNGTTGEKVTAISIAIPGFTYNDAESATTKTGTIAADGSLVLKLYYDRNLYKVTYEYEGDIPSSIPSLPPEEMFVFGSNVSVADRVTAPAGYTFIGWYRGEVTNIVTSFTMPNRDVVIEGYFAPGENTPFEVHHYLETLADGIYETKPEVKETFTGTTGHTVTATPLNRFTGFTYNEVESADTISGEIKGDGTLVLKVYYDRNKYNVTYGYDGDIPTNAPALPTGGAYTYGANVTVASPVTAPAGYTFVGWYRGTEDNHVSGTFKMPNYDVHILGNFEVNTNTPYKVEHYLQNTDGTDYVLDSSETRHGTTGTDVSALPKDYTGFAYNSNISTANGTIKGDGTLTLKFYYDRNVHKVTYVYEGIVPDVAPAVPMELSDVRYGTKITVADVPNIPGFTFDGWNTEDVNVTGGKFDMPDKDVVLKGNFTSNIVEYKVNYWFQKVDAGTTFNKADYELDSDSYTRTAYVGQHVEADPKVHTGFTLNTANSSKAYGHVTVDKNGNGNLVIDLYFDRNTYNVNYVYYGEQPANAPDISDRDIANVRYGTTVDIAAKPTLDNHAFEGWYTHTANVNNNQFVMPDHDVTILGFFVKQYKVIYDLNGGTGAEGVDYTAKAYDVGEVITVNAAPTRDGYNFKGWNEKETTFNPGDTVTVDRNITFVAQWSRKGGGGGGGGSTVYTLKYDTNGGNNIPSEKYNPNTVVELDKIPVKDGYVFDGWHIDEALSEDTDEVTMTKNITVYADWVKDNGTAGNGHPTPDGLNGEDHFAYVVGYPDGTVRPNDNITRAEVTSIFFRLLESEIRDGNLSENNNFNDVDSEDWYNTAISTMVKLGIVNGRTTNAFVPDANITRAEFAVICARFDDSEFEVMDNFNDVDSHWAADEIHEAAAHGWIRGYEDGTFKPDQYITRAEAMTMINRVLNRVPEYADDLLDEMVKWPDNSNESVWYYLPVQEATNSHNYVMKNNVYEKWTSLRDVTDWTKYE